MKRRLVRLAAWTWIALSLGCASLARDQSVCPEYRDIRCASAPECSMDRERGCRVCQCSPVPLEEGRDLPNGMPPDQRP